MERFYLLCFYFNVSHILLIIKKKMLAAKLKKNSCSIIKHDDAATILLHMHIMTL
jgi:hypothetical protein